VDLFARRLLIEKHPEWVKEALDRAEGKQTDLILSGGSIHLPHVKDSALLGSLFQTILSFPETSLTALQQFESGDAVFRFENIEKRTDPSIKTFKEALSDGSLEKIVEKRLRAKFAKLHGQLPGDKEFSAAKEQLTILLLKGLERAVSKEGIEEGSFATRRMAVLAARARDDLMHNPQEEIKWVKTEGELPLTSQFKLERMEKQISRATEASPMSRELFTLQPFQWTPIYIGEEGSVCFSYLKERQIVNEPVLEKLKLGKEKMGFSIQCLLAEKIFTRMEEKRAVIIPLQTETE